MGYIEIPNNLIFSTRIEEFTTETPGHAKEFNERFLTLLQSLAYLRENTKTIPDMYAKKSIYGDYRVNMGRKEGSAAGVGSIAFGTYLEASGDYSYAEGWGTTASDSYTHAEGYKTKASGQESHAEGETTTASAPCAHAEGGRTTASGFWSHAEGCETTASGSCAHAEGQGTIASEFWTHAEGYKTKASGEMSHAEGENTEASKDCAHAEGGLSVASGLYSHAEGCNTKASGNSSHTEGRRTEASGDYAHAEGYETTASNYSSHASGKYNKAMTNGGLENNQIGDAFVVGNGTGNSARSNALRVTFNGEIMGTKSYQSSGADYAEFIKPWADSNPDNEDRVGYFVTIKEGCLYKAEPGDYIAGITSGNPSIVGNADEDYYWRYERDEFNRIVMEDAPEIVQKTERKALMQAVHKKNEDGQPLYDESGDPIYEEIPVLDENGIQIYKDVPVYGENHRPVMVETGKIIKNARMKLAENYDPSLQENYTERKYRPEWDYVGMLGVLPVRDDGTCIPGQLCRCGSGGIATLAEERGFDTYMVIERIAENIVSVILK